MKPVVFRSSRHLVWLFAGITLFLFLPALMALLGIGDDIGKPTPSSAIVICSLLSTGMGAVTLWLGRRYIKVDDVGLHWRGIGPEHFTRWEEVTDYFIHLTPQGQRSYTIKAADGRQLSFDESLSGYKSLIQKVASQATQTKTSGWLLQSKAGTLSERQVFSYSEEAYQNFLWQQLLIPILPLIFVVLLLAFPETRALWFLPLMLTLVFFGAIPWAWRAIREAQHYRGSRLQADEHTLTFVRANGDTQTIRWSEVASVQEQMIGPCRRCELHTKDAQFYIYEYMEHWDIFRGLLHQYCPLILTHRMPTGDALLSTEKTNGRRVFHYQTRSNRRVLGAILVCVLLPLGIVFLPYVSQEIPLTLTLILVAGWAWSLWRYKSTRLVLDAEGITQFDLRGTTQVSYDAITWLGASDWFYVETADGKRPIRWSPGIADADQLRQELETRTGLSFNKEPTAPSPELIKKVQNPAEEANQIEQQLKRRHTGR